MNLMTAALYSIPCLSLALASVCVAQENSLPELTEKPLKPRGAGKGRNDVDLLKRFDTDGDGKLSKAERSQMGDLARRHFRGRREDVLKKYDLDKDGELSKDERAKVSDHMRRRGPGDNRDIFGNVRKRKPLEMFDADGDGKLSEEEKKNAEEFKENERKQVREALGKLRSSFVTEYDADQDGKISDTERAAAKEVMVAQWDAKKKQMLEEYDVDKNGELSREEHSKARREKKAKFLEKFDKDNDGEFNPNEQMEAFYSLLENDPAELMMLMRHKARGSQDTDKKGTGPSHGGRPAPDGSRRGKGGLPKKGSRL